MITATGKITRLYPYGNATAQGCWVRLDKPKATPKDGYFRLTADHPNYNSTYALLLAAAINRHKVTIRTKNPIDPAERAVIAYIRVDW